jgi:hypothetical protein
MESGDAKQFDIFFSFLLFCYGCAIYLYLSIFFLNFNGFELLGHCSFILTILPPLKMSDKMRKCKNGGFCWITDFNTKWNICNTYYTQVQLLWPLHKLEIFVSVWKVRSMNSSLNRKYLPPKILFDSHRKLKVDIRLLFWLWQQK